jgi:sugar/nucleoside kinase (ribokinase family)
MNPLSAIVAGHICLDIYPDLADCTTEQFKKSFIPGHLLKIGPLSYTTGGPVSNTGLALHKLGVETKLMGKIGVDFSGQAVKEIIHHFNPTLVEGMIEDPAENTSYSIVISPPGIDRFIMHYPGANDTFSSKDIRTNLLNDVRIFHFGYPPLMKLMYYPDGQELARIFQQAKLTGVTTSLDTAFPDPESPAGRANWQSILELTLPYVDIFMPSIEEILLMLDRPVYDELRQKAVNGDILQFITPTLLSDLSNKLLKMGAKIVGLKLGHRGLYLRSADCSVLNGMGNAKPSLLENWANKEFWSPCFMVNVIGTAGSGDATIAGFLSALLRDLSAAQAIEMAVAVGAGCVEAADSISGICSWEQVVQRMAGGWQKKPLDLTSYGWHFNTEYHHWVNKESL